MRTVLHRPFGLAVSGAQQAPQTSAYARVIGRLAPGEDASQVEADMRRRHGDLDQVDAVDFAREVKAAVARMHADRPPTHAAPARAATPIRKLRVEGEPRTAPPQGAPAGTQHD